MAWLALRLPPRIAEIIRFYQAAVINTVFGLSVYAALVWLGVNLYVAQALAHVCGIAFNYLSYSRHVFKDAPPAKSRFVAAYGVNYMVNLGFLAVFASVIASPYIAGLCSTLCASIVNYFALKYAVFARDAKP